MNMFLTPLLIIEYITVEIRLILTKTLVEYLLYGIDSLAHLKQNVKNQFMASHLKERAKALILFIFPCMSGLVYLKI